LFEYLTKEEYYTSMSDLTRNKISTKKYWGGQALGYWQLASIGLNSIIKKDNLGKFIWEHGTEQYEVFLTRDASLVFASIYSLKHGIELSVKSLEISIDGMYTKGHLKVTEKVLNDLKLRLERYCLPEIWALYENLVNKYINFGFDNSITQDPMNEMYRYPESLNGSSLDYSKVHKLSQPQVLEIINDIHDLELVFNILVEQYHLFKSCYDLGSTYEKIRTELLQIPTMHPKFKNEFVYT
jgi:hypothetical protein